MTTLLELTKKLHNTLALYNGAGHALGWKTEKVDKLLDESKRVIELAEQSAQQEPVAWLVCENWRKHSLFFTEEGAEDFKNAAQREDDLSGNLARWKAKPLYTSSQAERPWVGLTDDDKCVKELYESDTDPEWIDGYTAGLKDAENKLRRYNAQPALVVEQLNPVAEGKCEICNDPSNLVIDHCHNSKDVRGILCWSCNVALGHFKDSEERLTSALKYLCKFKQNTQTL